MTNEMGVSFEAPVCCPGCTIVDTNLSLEKKFFYDFYDMRFSISYTTLLSPFIDKWLQR